MMDDVAPYTSLCYDCVFWGDEGRCWFAPRGYTHPDKDGCEYEQEDTGNQS